MRKINYTPAGISTITTYQPGGIDPVAKTTPLHVLVQVWGRILVPTPYTQCPCDLTVCEHTTYTSNGKGYTFVAANERATTGTAAKVANQLVNEPWKLVYADTLSTSVAKFETSTSPTAIVFEGMEVKAGPWQLSVAIALKDFSLVIVDLMVDPKSVFHLHAGSKQLVEYGVRVEVTDKNACGLVDAQLAYYYVSALPNGAYSGLFEEESASGTDESDYDSGIEWSDDSD